jgi:hypothetical protein
MLTGRNPPPDDFAIPVSSISTDAAIVVVAMSEVALPPVLPVIAAFVSNHAASYVAKTALSRSVNDEPAGDKLL